MPFRTASLAVVSISLLAAAIPSAPAQDEQASLKDLESIGSALSSPDHRPVHIIYVHGINQVGAGDSSLLRDSICKELHLCDPSDWKYAGSEFPDKGEFAPGAAPPRLYYLGEPVWADEEQWEAAAPFVAHYVIRLKRYPAPLVVDEINWWPLVLALKCEHVVRSEASLAGANKDLLQVCSEKSAQDPGDLGRFYPWLSVSEADRLAKMPARAVAINRNLKNGLEDWGFSDAMIGVGPLSEIIRDGLRQLMIKSASFDPSGTDSSARMRYDWKSQLSSGNATDQTFIGVTHSLGSYLLFNTLNLEDIPPEAAAAQSLSAAQSETMDEDRAVQYIFERMSLVYFFANQLLLLEFTDVQGLPTEAVATPHAAGAPAPSTRHFSDLVSRWSQYRQAYQKRTLGDKAVPQNAVHIVAWSDPSDLLTWRMPKIGDVVVLNLYAHNATHWFWLYESPTGAHDNYAKNMAVLRVMFPKH
ncbi:MAG TPA: hypothetical protein VME23_09290 [Terracidiphilus sp.]|nr:hypothetical protein [Terracidiphilus sp.]